MNCQQTEKLLPSYAGGDLDEKRAGLVMAHLQSCANCADATDEYRETRQLVQHFAPPLFNEDVYAGIRRRVLREIETEAAASPAFSEIFAGLFRPSLRWAYVAALLAVSVFAIYFIASRQNDQHQFARNNPTVNKPAPTEPSKGRSKPASTATNSPPLDESSNKPLPKHIRPSRRTPTTAEVSSNSNLTESAVVPAVDSAVSEKTLRMEIQTKDPNIRIIWFSQHGT